MSNIGSRIEELIKQNIQKEERNKIARARISEGLELAKENIDKARILDEKFDTKLVSLLTVSEEEMLNVPGKAKSVHMAIQEELAKILDIIESNK